jgi:hypothetical protein
MKPYGWRDRFLISCANLILRLASRKYQSMLRCAVKIGLTVADSRETAVTCSGCGAEYGIINGCLAHPEPLCPQAEAGAERFAIQTRNPA